MTNVKNERKKLLTKIVVVLIAVVLSYFGINIADFIPEEEPVTISTQNGELELTMINVGQADSFLFRQNGYTALIDCGTRSTGDDVVKYLNEIGVNKLDYVIGTHPHDDHMGGMYDVITNFEVGEFIIPKVTKNKITTSWYTKLVKEIKTGGYKVVYPNVGDVYQLGDATMKVVGPFEEPESNLNNYSIVLKVSFGEMDVLMTGDAETEVEKQILKSGEDIDVEILKMGHHGSDTSSCDEFLNVVTPDYALISSKVGNKYNHPVGTTMEKLYERKVKVYRTDECGTVIATITSDNVEFSTKPGDYLSGPELEEKVSK